ncbi:MAG: hypothetical protein AB7F22_07790 [Reyranella sp.]|uniref:hypothetical protein n=1 Tax=Reyranella sp. TaxID=1929291 RepID=UPI003D137160
MRIALDFDGTYTLDPLAWDAFIIAMQRAGHLVMVVTLRAADADQLALESHFYSIGCPVIYCDGQPKHTILKEDYGYVPDIWIEDDPRSIHEGSRLNPEQLAAWREKDVHRKPRTERPIADHFGAVPRLQSRRAV